MKHRNWLAVSIVAFLMTSTASAQHQRVERFQEGKGIPESTFRQIEVDTATRRLNPRGISAGSKIILEAERSLRASTKIYGGEPTTIERNPWQVALIIGTAPDPIRQQFCGGSIIATRWILTAAHCVDRGTTMDRVNAVTGTTYYRYNGERLTIAKIVVHPQWNPATNENDLALLRLSTAVPPSSIVSLAPENLTMPDGSSIYVSGWGALAEGGAGTDILMGVDLPSVSREECNRPDSYNGAVAGGMFCAGRRAGGLDSCQGDSGGPASAVLDGTRTLVGIVSWGEGCARSLKYGVYTNVSGYRSWIVNTMGLSSD